MFSINRAEIIGNLGRDPEIRTLNSGAKVASFSVATSESWKDKTTGERKEAVQWHNVVIFNDGLCGIVERNLAKGSKVYVAGRIETRKYTDKSGVERWTTEIVLRAFAGELVILDRSEGARPPPNDAAEREGRNASYGDMKGRGAETKAAPANDLDDDIPF